MIDFTRCRIPPFAHQRVGTEALISHPYFFLADEMGAGKTKQVIDAAQFLYLERTIKRILVIAPAPVRGVWYDQELGELAKHLWADVSSLVMEYHNKTRAWIWAPEAGKPDARLEWYVTNYDYIRTRAQLIRKKVVLDPVLDMICTPETLLVLDESSAVKNHKAKQSKACLWIRNRCGRVVLLNGTPITNSPLDMYSQGHIMHSSITGHKSFYTFRAQFAIVIQTEAGFPKITGYQNIPELQRRFAPYILLRLKKDCIDLPKKLASVAVTSTLTQVTWSHYCNMRDELCVWLNEHDVSTAPQAGVKIMRLAQITSGFLGGVEPSMLDDPDDTTVTHEGPVIYIGREKLDTFLDRLDLLLEEDPHIKIVVWTHFRPALKALMQTLETAINTKRIKVPMELGQIHGSQPKHLRDQALRLLDPRTAPKCAGVVGGIPSVGSMGLTLTAARHAIYLSNNFSVKTRQQSEDRLHRPTQTCDVSYNDIIAVGPKGQQTIDHLTLKALRGMIDVAQFTSAGWVSALRRE